MEISYCEHYVSKGDEILESCVNEQYYPFNLCNIHLPKCYLVEVHETSERPCKKQKLDKPINTKTELNTENSENSDKHNNRRKQCIYIRRNGFQCLTKTTSDNGLCSQHKNCRKQS